eukprot:gb/GECG01002402.1/.p1 GENE.gb/GECG01002402.1/~~gb/GECG01002402.1/.p1  ORF type:complete len:1093 (+),score=74.68 gb/GECG01002402.1/:1-3279(+)
MMEPKVSGAAAAPAMVETEMAPTRRTPPNRGRTGSRAGHGSEVKAVPPLIRLETLDSTAVRTTIVCTYMTLFVSIALGVVSEFGHHSDTAWFAIRKCPQGEQTRILPGEGCFVNVDTAIGSTGGNGDGRNRSLWAGMTRRIASGLGEFHENLKFETQSGYTSIRLTYRSQLFRSADESKAKQGITFRDAFNGHELKSDIPGWTELVQSDLYEDVHLDCSKQDPCQFEQPIFSDKSSRGTAKLHNFLVTTYFEDNGLHNIVSLSTGAWFQYVFVDSTFRAFVIGIRGSFCLVTVILLGTWVFNTNLHYQRDDPHAAACARCKRCCVDSEYWNTWLPQRRWVFWVGVALFWWQNPLFVLDALISRPSNWLHVFVQSVGDIAWTCIFALLIALVGGLQRPHPYGRFELGFYLPKVAFALVLSGVSVGQRTIRAFELKDGYGYDLFEEQEGKSVLIVDLVLGLLSIVLHLLWVVWFFITLYRTKEALELFPYSKSRYQRLTFRFVIWQSVTVILYVAIFNIVNLFRAFLGADSTDNQNSNDALSRAARLVRIATEGYQPIGAYIVSSVYAYILLFCFLPPRSDGPQSTLGKVGNAVTNLLGIVTGSGTGLHKRTFSLEMASWLFDFAWAAYFDPPTSMRVDADQEWEIAATETSSSCGPLHTAPHGFEIEGFVYSRRTDTIAVVFRKGFQVVVAFRGTASRTNVLTDVKFNRRAAELSSTSHNEMSAIPGFRQVLPLIHQGFWDAYQSVQVPLRNVVGSSIAQAGSKAILYCTGHSLGGALATIAAYDMKEIVRDIRQHSTAIVGRSRSRLGSFVDNVRSFFGSFSASRGASFAEMLDLDGQDNRFDFLDTSDGKQEESKWMPYRRTAAEGSKDAGASKPNPLNATAQRGNSSHEPRRTRIARASRAKNNLISKIKNIPENAADAEVGVLSSDKNDHTNEKEEDGYVTVYTFGSPRVGNRAFSRSYNNEIPWSFRIVSNGDIVAGIPKFCFMYKHVGTMVWIDLDGNLIVDPSVVETKFVSHRKTSLNVHQCTAYRRAILLSRIQYGLTLRTSLRDQLDIADEEHARFQLLGETSSSLPTGKHLASIEEWDQKSDT